MVQLMPETYKDIEIMLDYEQEKVMTLGELMSALLAYDGIQYTYMAPAVFEVSMASSKGYLERKCCLPMALII